MRNLSVAELVNDALLKTGCDPKLIQKLDAHATVQIDLVNAPPIFIGESGEHVVIWSDLCEFHDRIMQHCSAALLQEIMRGYEYGRSEQLVLRESEGYLQIFSDLVESCLENSADMANAINAFFEQQTRLLEILRQ